MRFRIEASVQECLGEDCPEEFLPVFHLEAVSAVSARRDARLIIGNPRIVTLGAFYDPVTYDEIPQQRQICSNMLNFLG
jgi:hypothetical protein